MQEAFETILFEKRGHIAHVTLNRPHVLNAYNIKMRDEMYEVLGAVALDDDIYVMVIKGAGEKAFCAGADLSEFLSAPPPVFARKARFERDIWGRFLSLPQPVIVALHGYVLGSGVEIALYCDLRIASRDAVFGMPEVALGIIPAAGGTQTLPRAMGSSRTLEMLYSGRRLTAEEALEAKLINRVMPREELHSTVENLAQELCQHNPRILRNIKKACRHGLDMPLAHGLRLERALALGQKSNGGKD